MSRRAAGRRTGDDRPSVLFLNRVYPPDPGATGQLLAELAGALARRGWRTGVLACGGAGAAPRRETRAGVLVRRAWSLPLTRKTPLRRLAAYLSAWPAMLAEMGRLGGWDACVVMTDPPLLPVLGPAARRLLSRPGRPCRLAAWIQDLHPELAEGIGALRPGGRFLVIGFAGGKPPALPLKAPKDPRQAARRDPKKTEGPEDVKRK